MQLLGVLGCTAVPVDRVIYLAQFRSDEGVGIGHAQGISPDVGIETGFVVVVLVGVLVLGMLILTTSKGIMTHEQARTAGVGGTLLAYVY